MKNKYKVANIKSGYKLGTFCNSILALVLFNPIKRYIGIRNSSILNNNNLFYSTEAFSALPIRSLREIVEFKSGIVKTNPYQGLLKGKEKLKFKLGQGKIYPTPSEYEKYEDICDWQFRIKQIIKEELITGQTYDIAVMGRDILNEEYITYGRHFLINSESNINAVITKIEGNILVNSISLNSGEIGVAKEAGELEAGLRLIVFYIRPVSFESEVHKIANKLLLSKAGNKISKAKNKQELLKLNNTKIKALINSLPNSNLISELGSLIEHSHKESSGIVGSLFKYKKYKILIHNTNIHKSEGIEGIVYKNDHEFFRYTDKTISENAFLRSIGNTTIKYVNNQINYIDSKINSKLVEPLKMEIVRDKNYGTFDIETALDINNKFIPVSCGWKNNKNYKDYIITNYDSTESMFKNCFEDMFNYNNYTWYAHNLGGFDVVFILKILFDNYTKTKVQFKDGKPLSIKVSWTTKDSKNKNKTKNIVFKDSYKIQPLSIRNLIKAMDITTQKLYFPYLFMKTDNMNYEGKLPDKSYFENISDLEYSKIAEEFKDKNWILKDELLKYMKNDIVSLYQIIDKFSKELYELENLNITSVSTLSTIALNTYLTKYYNEKKTPIHIPRYANYLDIKNAYFGGRVEVLKGYAENIYIYDVVSLYPYCMLKDLPVGEMSKSTDTNLNNYFGFCYATVNVPKGIRAPLLPFRRDNGGLIYPTGTWSGWFTSEILKKARDTQKVKIQVHHGYKMEKSKDLFSKFVEKYSKIKIMAEKEGNNAKRSTAKLILNSLYGRLGLKYEPYKIDFVSSSVADLISINHEVIDRLSFDNYIELIKYTTAPSEILKELNREEYNKLKSKTDLNGEHVVRSLTIPAMITSHGSIAMNPFLNIPDNPCYYTDTDSLFLKSPLDDKYVGTELGKFSFKGLAKRAYFISPKTYCLIMEDDSIIIKCKGLNKKLLNENHFKELLSGKNVTIDTRKIFTNLKKGTGGIKSMNFTIKPEINNRKSIKGEHLNFETEPFHVIDGVVQ
uniref:DNA polymerase n=1 Tax=Termitomyces sp. K2P1 TaxID=2811480 RepID=A0A8F1D631_9AGAR|nr:DNA polymerase [Termitomyces sp. K2P1]